MSSSHLRLEDFSVPTFESRKQISSPPASRRTSPIDTTCGYPARSILPQTPPPDRSRGLRKQQPVQSKMKRGLSKDSNKNPRQSKNRVKNEDRAEACYRCSQQSIKCLPCDRKVSNGSSCNTCALMSLPCSFSSSEDVSITYSVPENLHLAAGQAQNALQRKETFPRPERVLTQLSDCSVASVDSAIDLSDAYECSRMLSCLKITGQCLCRPSKQTSQIPYRPSSDLQAPAPAPSACATRTCHNFGQGSTCGGTLCPQQKGSALEHANRRSKSALKVCTILSSFPSTSQSGQWTEDNVPSIMLDHQEFPPPSEDGDETHIKLEDVPEAVTQSANRRVSAQINCSSIFTGDRRVLGNNFSGHDRSPCESEGEYSFAATPTSEDLEEACAREVEPSFINVQGLLLKRMLEEYLETLSSQSGEMLSRSGSEYSSPGPAGAPSRVRANDPKKTPNKKKPSTKRRRVGNSDRGGESDDEEENHHRPETKLPKVGDDNALVLACPYYKHDPRRYSELNVEEVHYRHCSSVLTPEIFRLKQHLYRVHRRPEYYCAKCYTTFKDRSRVDAHTRQGSCDNKSCPWEEKMNAEQMRDIRRRVPGRTKVENWNDIYRTLFPNFELPQSPFKDLSELEQRIAVFFANSAPRVFRDLLRELGHEHELADMQQQLLESTLPQFVPRVLEQLQQGVITALAAPPSSRTASSESEAQQVREQPPRTPSTQNGHLLPPSANIRTHNRTHRPERVDNVALYHTFALPSTGVHLVGPNHYPSPAGSGMNPFRTNRSYMGSDIDQEFNFEHGYQIQSLENHDSDVIQGPQNDSVWQLLNSTGNQFPFGPPLTSRPVERPLFGEWTSMNESQHGQVAPAAPAHVLGPAYQAFNAFDSSELPGQIFPDLNPKNPYGAQPRQ